MQGCFLETAQRLEIGVGLSIALMDHQRGEALNVVGRVARTVAADEHGLGAGIGVQLIDPPAEWTALVAHYERGPRDGRSRRLTVLVVGDRNYQRGALALYVTSGWDVRFASDADGAAEALHGVSLDAVIAEYAADDDRWRPILSAAKSLQPQARRVLRSSRHGAAIALPNDLVQHTVAREAGLDALVEALAAAR